MAGLSAPGPTPVAPTPPSGPDAVRRILRLRWRLLRATATTPGPARWGLLVATSLAIIGGVIGGAALAFAVPTLDDDVRAAIEVLVIVGVAVAAAAAAVATGTSQPVDPRVIAAEPIGEAPRAIGIFTSSGLGPGGGAIGLLGLGLVVGRRDAGAGVAVVAAAVVCWCLAVLAASRIATNVLGLVAVRRPRLGQVLVALTAIGSYLAAQLVASSLSGVDRDELVGIGDAAALNPVGQLGRAISSADDEPVTALAHLGLASPGVALLVVVALLAQQRLATARRPDDTRRRRTSAERTRGPVALACGGGPSGAVARRALLTRWRTPRTALETVTGAGFGLGAVLVPALLRDDAGGGAVLVGGAVQLAALFVAGNVFGNDGPPITHELLTGTTPDVVVRGTARSVLVTIAPLVVAGPVVAAAITGAWSYVPAGMLMGVGGAGAGVGAAVVQATYVPIAVPDSDNPFETGESGRGLLAALLLVGVLMVLAIATAPFALAAIWAVDGDRPGVLTAVALGAAAAGVGLHRLGLVVAARRWRAQEPETLAALVPAR